MRLDRQRPPLKTHKRLNQRPMTRGYDIGPHTVWGDNLKISPQKSAAQPADVFIGEATVTASDGTNAARLGPLGYVALPTSNWTTGQKITVGGFDFNWTGAAWAAGTHA